MRYKVLRPHQKKMLRYTLKNKHPFLAVKMRLGKTLVCIRTIKTYSNCKHVLIMAPYECFIAWEDELKGEGEGQLIEISGKSSQRLSNLESDWDSNKWFFASKESCNWAPEVLLKNWDCVIIDEGTFIKEPQTNVTKFCMKYFRDVPHRWNLTGTPDPQGPINYFCQLKYLDNNYLPMYKNYWDFRNRGFELANSWTYNYELTKKGKKDLHECLAKHVFFMDRKQAGIKENRVDQARYIKMPPKILKLYNKLEKEYALGLLNDSEKELKRTKWATSRHEWLKDLCNGFIEKELIWAGKLNQLSYLLENELKGEKVIIYATRIKYLHHILAMLRKRYRCSLVHGETPKAKRNQIFRDFQAGKIKYLIGNPDCMQFSLNLSISDTIIHYDSTSMMQRLQAEERIFDMKKAGNGNLLYLDLVIKDTIEDDFYNNRIICTSDMEMTRTFIKRIVNKYAIKKIA